MKHKASSQAGAAQQAKDNPIVASLSQKSPHPFSSIALSPNREYAVTARKDTLLIVQVGPLGILPFKSIPIAQHFQTKVSTVAASSHGSSNSNNNNSGNNMGRIYEDVRDTFVRDAFSQRTGSSQASSNNINVILTDVAWSKPTTEEIPPTGRDGNSNDHSNDSSLSSSSKKKKGKAQNKADNTAKTTEKDTGAGTSLIAAAGSNGVIVVWTAETLLEGESGHFPAPDAILSQHARAVNRLAWHPRRPGLLLSASQDGTVILWERIRKVTTTDQQRRQSKQSTKQGFSFFGGMKTQSNQKRSYSWQCRATFEPKSEAVRDIQWSPFHDDGTLSCVA
jgi:WD40 repeat protein